jgi:hypothetical protein
MRFIMCNLFMDIENYAKSETDLCTFGRTSRRIGLTSRPIAKQCTEKKNCIRSYPGRYWIIGFQLFSRSDFVCTLNGMADVFRVICRVIKLG